MSSASRSPPARTDPETLYFIHQRYEDASQVIFRQHQRQQRDPTSYLSFGESSKRYAYSRYGNAAVVVRKAGRNMTKMDEKSIQSSICTIM